MCYVCFCGRRANNAAIVGDSAAVCLRRDMAVFLLNICKFNGCGITFPSLGDLIQHIEDTHIGKFINKKKRKKTRKMLKRKPTIKPEMNKSEFVDISLPAVVV